MRYIGYYFYRAQTVGKEPASVMERAAVRITFEKSFPDNITVDEASELFADQAGQLFVILRDTLPGGTLDRLLGNLLQYKASHFVISFAQKK